MCGVPVHAADDYLQKLIGLGLPRRGLRADRGSGRGEEARLEIGGAARRGPAGDAGHHHRGQAAGAVGIELPDGAGAREGRRGDVPTRWPGSTSRPASSALPRPPPTGLLADIFRVDPRELIVAEPVFHDRGAEAGVRHARPRRQPAAAEPVRFGVGAAAASPASSASRRRTVSAPSRAPSCRRSRASSPMSRRRRRPSGRRCRGPEREEAGSTLFIDPATRANLELLRTHVGQPRRLAVQGDRPHGDRRRRAAARRAADVAADRSGGDQPAAGFGRRSSSPSRSLCDALARQPEGASPTCRARCRGWRSTAAARATSARCAPGFERGGGDRRAARRRARCRPNSPRRCAAHRGAAADACASISTARSADELPLLKRDGGFVRAGYDAELDEMRALRDAVAPRDRRHGARPDRGDRHPLAEDPAQQCARLLHRGDRQPPGDHERHRTRRRRASSTARPWRAPCASPRPSWPSWRRRSPTPPTGRWRSSLASSTGWWRKRSAEADAIRAGARGAGGARRVGGACACWPRARTTAGRWSTTSLAFAGRRRAAIRWSSRRCGRQAAKPVRRQ